MAAPTMPPRAYRRFRAANRTATSGRSTALLFCITLSTLAVGPSADRLLAQIADDVRADTVRPLFTRTDAVLAGTLLSSLVFIDPIERLDHNLSDIAQRDAASNLAIYQLGEAMGRGRVTLALAAAPLAWGLVAQDSKARSVGLHALESLFATSFLTRFLKEGIGRMRPSCSDDSDAFVPFSSEPCYHSFPSGHTARTFAVATTFSLEFGESSPWVPWLSYSLATWTALTRVRDGAHWPTDVVGGAALGIFTARLVHRINHDGSREDPILLAIHVAPDGGMGISARLAVR